MFRVTLLRIPFFGWYAFGCIQASAVEVASDYACRDPEKRCLSADPRLCSISARTMSNLSGGCGLHGAAARRAERPWPRRGTAGAADSVPARRHASMNLQVSSWWALPSSANRPFQRFLRKSEYQNVRHCQCQHFEEIKNIIASIYCHVEAL